MGIFPSLPCSFLCCFEDSEVKDPWKDPCRHLPVRFGSSIFVVRVILMRSALILIAEIVGALRDVLLGLEMGIRWHWRETS